MYATFIKLDFVAAKEQQESNMEAICTNPEILQGTPVFKGTRVPIRILFEYLEAGDNLSQFLEEFPSVSKQMAQAVLAQDLAAASRDAQKKAAICGFF